MSEKMIRAVLLYLCSVFCFFVAKGFDRGMVVVDAFAYFILHFPMLVIVHMDRCAKVKTHPLIFMAFSMEIFISILFFDKKHSVDALWAAAPLAAFTFFQLESLSSHLFSEYPDILNGASKEYPPINRNDYFNLWWNQVQLCLLPIAFAVLYRIRGYR